VSIETFRLTEYSVLTESSASAKYLLDPMSHGRHVILNGGSWASLDLGFVGSHWNRGLWVSLEWLGLAMVL
jgi:hypothetical protein